MHMLTPDYAAPEQVRGEAVTTATDVYALGVLLFELVTSQRPHTFRTLTAQEIERVVCDTEAPRPSTIRGRPARRPRHHHRHGAQQGHPAPLRVGRSAGRGPRALPRRPADSRQAGHVALSGRAVRVAPPLGGRRGRAVRGHARGLLRPRLAAGRPPGARARRGAAGTRRRRRGVVVPREPLRGERSEPIARRDGDRAGAARSRRHAGRERPVLAAPRAGAADGHDGPRLPAARAAGSSRGPARTGARAARGGRQGASDDVADTLAEMGEVVREKGDYQEAERLHRRALADAAAAARPDPRQEWRSR